MSDQLDSNLPIDSLDIVELVMAIEETLDFDRTDPRLTASQRERLIREIAERIKRGELGDDEGDAIAGLVRNLGPRDPKGLAGAEVPPKEPSFD
jgi:hypothetical protein